MLGYLWDAFTILSTLVLILSLVAQGYIPLHFGALVLVGVVFFIASGRGSGGNIDRLVRFLFRVGFPLVSLGTLVVIFSGGNYEDIVLMLGEIGRLCLVLAGFYVMFWGFSSRQRK